MRDGRDGATAMAMRPMSSPAGGSPLMTLVQLPPPSALRHTAQSTPNARRYLSRRTRSQVVQKMVSGWFGLTAMSETPVLSFT